MNDIDSFMGKYLETLKGNQMLRELLTYEGPVFNEQPVLTALKKWAVHSLSKLVRPIRKVCYTGSDY